MYAESFDIKACLAGVKVLILNLALGVSVPGVTIVSAELFYIEVCGSGANLFVRRKCNAELSVWDVFRLYALDHGKNLSDTGFVVSAEHSSSITGNQSTPL